MTYSGSSSVVWEALGCLAGIDWTALFFWCLITFSLCLVSILLISIFLPVSIKEDERLPAAEPGQSPQGLEVFQQLFTQKLLPIDSSTGWQLLGVHHELRSWEKKVELGGTYSCYGLHGSSAVVSSSAKDILETLKDITKTLEWDSEVTESNYISFPSTTDASDHPLTVDVVSLTLPKQKTLSDAFLDRLVAVLAMPYNILSIGSGYFTNRTSQKPAVVARSWKMEGDTSGWMFSRTVFKGKGHTLDELWSYTLVQPAAEDPNKSLMHHITCSVPSARDSSLCEKPALRLAALKQYFEMKRLKVSPLCHSSLKHLTSHALQSKACTNGTSDKSVYCSLRDSLPDSVMPIYTALDTTNNSDSQLTQRLNLNWPDDTHRPRTSSLGMWHDNSSSDDAGFYSERQHRSRKQRVKKTMSADVAAGGDRKRNSLERKTGSLDRTTNEKGSGDLEDSGVVDNMVEYQLLADEGAELVLEESIRAAGINVNVPEDDQMQQTGGWSFHCLEKDVVILKKPKNGKYYSFLGKGIIKASPTRVFKAIRNPRTRFTYDTMLKKMNIVKTFSEDLCVYCMVHEVPQLLKKESRDFCVLQVCKTVDDRHIVSCRSIECKDCPEEGSLVRGHILPSGWVIEPVGNQYSMVTYITQVALCGKDVPAAFSQFLSVRVPLSIAYLRLFLEAQLP